MEDRIRTLDMLEEGECARVQMLCMSGAIRRRLQDIGLIAGTTVRCLLKSPSGDPAAYCIRGAVIALRKNDAKGLQVHE